MKRFYVSIKLRVTLWYTFLTLFIVFIVAQVLVASVQRATQAYYEDLLSTAMADAAETVHYHDGKGILNLAEAEDFDRVRFSLMDAEGNLWAGHWPRYEEPFADGTIRRVRYNGSVWLIQDLFMPFEEGDLWLRGSISLDPMHFLEETALGRLQVMIPALILLLMTGGFLLTRRAFRPIVRMASRAQGITEGHQLSERFDHADRQDEFGQLAHTFNLMFSRLEDSFRRERQFTDDASHELRTPISVIQAASEYGLSGKDIETKQEALEMIREKARDMEGMVNQLLQMARMDGGRVQLMYETIDFSLLCRSLCEDTLRGKSVDLQGIEEGVFLEGDELMLMRLVTNLLDNARKFSHERVSVSLTGQAQKAVLTVADDGDGIASSVLPHVFDRFYQAAPDRSASSPGAGLGLPMARQIARLHGGDIQACSVPGEGSSFQVILPLRGKKE